MDKTRDREADEQIMCEDANADIRYATRASKAAKIVEIVRDVMGDRLETCRALDIGCATGAISNRIAPHVAELTGLDFDGPAVGVAAAYAVDNARYLIGDGSSVPFDNEQFDLVICAQVYEHAPRQQLLAGEVWRVLRPGGVCFFSGPNRLAVIEEHYWLPFLSWLPQIGADGYMQLFGRGSVYDVMPRSFWRLRRLWSAFEIRDYTVEMLVNPNRYDVGDKLGRLEWVGRLPRPILHAAQPFLPNFNWILVKRA